jgi:nonspecific dipeptidase
MFTTAQVSEQDGTRNDAWRCTWLSSPSHPNYAAVVSGIEKVFRVTTALEEATGMNALLPPVGACDDMAHSQNGKENASNLMNGNKVLRIYSHEWGNMQGPKLSDCRCVLLTEEELRCFHEGKSASR